MNFPFGVYAHTSRSRGKQELKGMLRMDWTSGGRKTCLTKSICHSHFRGSMRSLSLESLKVLFGGEITLKVDGLGNHLSVQMPTDAPFPTYHLQPCLTIFLCYHHAPPSKRRSRSQYSPKEVTIREIASFYLWTSDDVFV